MRLHYKGLWYLHKYNKELFWYHIKKTFSALTIAGMLTIFVLWLVSMLWAYEVGLHDLHHWYNITPIK